jgi:hypothetical protein
LPAKFFVHRYICGEAVCGCRETMVQQSVELRIIDDGMPTTGCRTPAGRLLRRPPAQVPAGAGQCALKPAHAALDAGGVVWRGRGERAQLGTPLK